MSALPAAVQKQIERANEIARQVYGDASNEAAKPNEAAQEPEKAEATPPEQQASTPQPAPTQDWEQKYRVLQGKYNSEIPRLQDQIRTQSTQIRTLQDQITSTQALLTTVNERRNEEPVVTKSSKKFVKDEEIEVFGSDLYDFIQRAAKESVLPEVEARVQTQLQPVTQKVDQVASSAQAAAQFAARTSEQKVFDLLSEHIPNWSSINEDENFLDWLDLADPYSGQKRGELLTAAFKRHDGPRVLAFFKGYLNENTAAGSTGSAPPAQAQKKLENLVAPGAPKAGAASAQEGAGKRIWTSAEIKQFFHDLQRGKYKTRPEYAKKLEADIFAAQAENRIRL